MNIILKKMDQRTLGVTGRVGILAEVMAGVTAVVEVNFALPTSNHGDDSVVRVETRTQLSRLQYDGLSLVESEDCNLTILIDVCSNYFQLQLTKNVG